MWLADETATAQLGRRIGEIAPPGTVIALVGDLGMGKSVLARGIARGLGLTERIPSPTFVILCSYTDGRIPLHHADLYRLCDPEELIQLGFEDLLGVEGISVVEWADRFSDVLPVDHLRITLVERDEGRAVTLDAMGPRAEQLKSALV